MIEDINKGWQKTVSPKGPNRVIQQAMEASGYCYRVVWSFDDGSQTADYFDNAHACVLRYNQLKASSRNSKIEVHNRVYNAWVEYPMT